MKVKHLTYLLLMLLLISCSNESYDTGDGSLSNMRVDFVDAITNSYAQIYRVETDDNEVLDLTTPISVSWTEEKDTTYRALLYYNKIASYDGSYQAEAIAISQVQVLSITPTKDFLQEIFLDPVNFVSIWKSKQGKYINLDFYIKVGILDQDQQNLQVLGVLYDGETLLEDGTRKVTLRLYHNQNSMPEYYSQEVYVSIMVDDIPTDLSQVDQVEFIINTYDGQITKTIDL